MAFLEFILGFAITAVTLVDVFGTILVPGPAHTGLHVVGRMRQFSLPLWRWMSGGRPGSKRVSNSFAPLLFSLAFLSWLLLLCAGFALMLHAMGDTFRPALQGIGDAFYLSGAYLLTIGSSLTEPHGFARVLVLFAALSGFGVITATITFILEIQNNLHERESGVLKLSGMAGNPPTGVGLLETYAALGMKRDLGAFFQEWAAWSASVMNSHVSFPVLVYFHSIGAESDWVNALQLVLDAATMVMVLTDDESVGSAVYLHRAGSRSAAHICGIFHLREREEANVDEQTMLVVVERLRRAGYSLKDADSAALKHLNNFRADYLGRVRAIGDHLGSGPCRLTPPPHGSQDYAAPL